jgi:acetylornithine deacetylase
VRFREFRSGRSKGASFISAEIGRGSSRPARLGGKAKTCPLSSGFGFPRIGWSATGKYAQAAGASPTSILSYLSMNIFELTRSLVDVESITRNEERMGNVLFEHLSELASKYGGRSERMEVEPKRFNVFAHWGNPVVTLSTHMDTVPPFFPSREDETHIWGRGSCDTKGIIAAMLFAVRELLEQGTRDIGLLFVVGEERNSAGAFAAAKNPRGSKFIINGEPTENKLAIGSKGALRLEFTASGRMAHSAYPELGESAIEKLLDALNQIRRMPLPVDKILGASTVNIGTISGGRAPNVIADHAKAELFIRLVDDGAATRQAVHQAVKGVEVREVLMVPAVHMGTLAGFETTVVAFTTDIPAFGGSWGEPYLIGPGSIHVAHTDEERIPKNELMEAVQIYKRMIKQLRNE